MNYDIYWQVLRTGKEGFGSEKVRSLPNHKTVLTTTVLFSSEILVMNYDLSEATYEKKKEIIK